MSDIEKVKQRYIDAALIHSRATGDGDVKTTNKQADKLDRIYRMVDSGKIDHDFLTELLDHEHISVRGWAAAHLLRLGKDTLRAEETLQTIASLKGQNLEEKLSIFDAEILLEEWRGEGLSEPPESESDGEANSPDRVEPEQAPKSFGSPTHPEGWEQQRERHYKKYLGAISDTVMHDTSLAQPHIDIFQVLPNAEKGRDFTTLITDGMSDLLQNLPKAKGTKGSGRTELIWYVTKPEGWMFDFLNDLARIPFQLDTYFGELHTVENTLPSVYPNSKLKHIVLLPPPENEEFGTSLVLGGKRVGFLWVYPITDAELKYKLENGAGVFLDLLVEKNPPRVFSPYRDSMV